MTNTGIIFLAFGVLLWLLAACGPAVARRQNDAVVLSAAAIEQGASKDTPSTAQPTRIDKSQFKRAAEIASATWLNTETTDWHSLRGHVVVVDFWTFGCYNCKNTLPYFKKWDEKYRAQGLVVLGVHTPELSYERDVENVRRAVREYDIKYPVAIDGDFANWNRYGVRAWPTWFIVDKEGYIRYSHIGEGAYETSEQVIRELLAE
jgi:thiol-disulfide isomerase/thioredoxin